MLLLVKFWVGNAINEGTVDKVWVEITNLRVFIGDISDHQGGSPVQTLTDCVKVDLKVLRDLVGRMPLLIGAWVMRHFVMVVVRWGRRRMREGEGLHLSLGDMSSEGSREGRRKRIKRGGVWGRGRICFRLVKGSGMRASKR